MCNGPHEVFYLTREQYFCGCKIRLFNFLVREVYHFKEVKTPDDSLIFDNLALAPVLTDTTKFSLTFYLRISNSDTNMKK
jgi:hypothetical protein